MGMILVPILQVTVRVIYDLQSGFILPGSSWFLLANSINKELGRVGEGVI